MKNGELKEIALTILGVLENLYVDALSLRAMMRVHGLSDLEEKAKAFQEIPGVREEVRQRLSVLRDAILQAKDSDTLLRAFLDMPTRGPIQ